MKRQSQARKQRRSYELWLKKNNPVEYRAWKSSNLLRGKKIQEENAEIVRSKETESLEKRQAQIITEMRRRGMSDSEINRHIEIWVKTVKLWGSEESLSWKDAVREWESEKEEQIV
jgi:hypothetical protein